MSATLLTPAPTIVTRLSRRAGILESLEANQGLLLIVGLIAAYFPPLARSLWLDEAGTWWMASHGPLAAIERTSHWPGQSILFAVITSFFCLDQSSPLRDLAMRIPALLGAGAACWFLYRFAEDLFGKGAGRIAALIFVFSPATIMLATEARPYSLALAAVAASCWTLYRWEQSRERRWLAGYVLSSTLVIYLHYMFIPILAAHAAFLMFGMIRERSLRRSSELAMSYLLIALLAVPLARHMLFLAHESYTLPWTPPPSGLDLAEALMPPLYMVGAFVAALLVALARGDENDGSSEPVRFPPPVRAMLFTWWIAGPLFLYAVTNATAMHVFHVRYVAYSGLALALILTWTACSAFGVRTAFLWVLMLVALVTATNLMLLAASTGPSGEELGPSIKLVQSESAKTPEDLPPVIFQSALPESNFYWRPGDSSESFWYAPMSAYPMKNKVLGVPRDLTPQVKDYIDELLKGELRETRKVLFVPHDTTWATWLTERFTKEGFAFRFQRPNAYYVIVFERAAPAAR